MLIFLNEQGLHADDQDRHCPESALVEKKQMSLTKSKELRNSRRRRRKIIRDSDPDQILLDDSPAKFLVDAQIAFNAGQHSEAIDILKQGIGQDSFAAYSAIGDIYLFCKENEKALEWLQKAYECRQDCPDVIVSIALTLDKLGRRDQAVEKLAGALTLQRDEKSLSSLTESLLQMDSCELVVETLQEMIQADATRTDAMFVLAAVFKETDRLDTARDWYKKILEQGENLAAYNELASCCQRQGYMSKAIEYLRKGIKLYPDRAALWNNLANILMKTGKAQESIDLSRKAARKMPDSAMAHSNLLLNMHHAPKIDRREMFAEHERWGRLHSPPTRQRTTHCNAPDPNRKLRVGYISADFRMHSVSYFFEPLLEGHDSQEMAVYGYGSVQITDSTTTRLKSRFDHYQNIYRMSDEQAANVIEHDKIDILVDLSGHTGRTRLSVLKYKPAPIQVSYLGYPDTTGMPQIDYRLTDALANPAQSQEFYTEQLVFLPHGFLCYTPPDYAPTVAVPPVARNGYITFGSFNNNCKINPSLISLWAQILKANQGSRLLLKFRGGNDEDVADYYYRQFEQVEIPRGRIEICGRKTPVEHFQTYGEVDIALDSYPYNGTTTTCEALWMGVPVVSLVGESHMSRVGLSILTRLGLEFFAASTPDEYVSKATALAAKPDALAKIRCAMRARIAKSGLCYAMGFAADVEAAYRKMWHTWCKTQGGDVSGSMLKQDATDTGKDAVLCCSQSKPAAARQAGKTDMPRKLHIGGKMRHSDWEVFNVQPGDYVDHIGNAKDLSRFEDETFDELYASHVVEHFDYNGPLQEALNEWYRVLKPEGKLYISVPDMDILCRLFQKTKGLKLKNRFQIVRMMFGGHTDQYDYHYTGLDFDILTRFLAQAGFQKTKQVENLGIFKDSSLCRVGDVLISLNVIAVK